MIEQETKRKREIKKERKSSLFVFLCLFFFCCHYYCCKNVMRQKSKGVEDIFFFLFFIPFAMDSIHRCSNSICSVCAWRVCPLANSMQDDLFRNLKLNHAQDRRHINYLHERLTLSILYLNRFIKYLFCYGRAFFLWFIVLDLRLFKCLQTLCVFNFVFFFCSILQLVDFLVWLALAIRNIRVLRRKCCSFSICYSFDLYISCVCLCVFIRKKFLNNLVK